MAQTPHRLLKNGRVALSAHEAVPADILISRAGTILAVEAGLSAIDCAVVDLGGRLVTPGFIDMHQHLDKSFTIADAPNPDGTLLGAIKAFAAYSRGLTTEDILARAQSTLDACIAHGTVAIRTHANVDHDLQQRSAEAMVELRARNADRIRLDVVAFMTSSAAKGDIDAARALLEQALAGGADTIGGTPNLAPDPAAYISMLLDMAERHDRRVDLHIDESLDPEARWFDYLVAQTEQRGLQGRVVASHVSSLSAVSDDDARRSIDAAAAAGVGICTLPAANLFLQGRAQRQLVPRGLTRVAEMIEAGLTVATASDNIQDAFVPVGSGDMLEMARWTALAAHLLRDPMDTVYRMIGPAPAALMGLEGTGAIAVGQEASFVISTARDPAALIASGAMCLDVMYRGNFVAGALAGDPA
ncbi:amidohydrolase family protein [Oceanibium sediminis]|uniref:amidohydrolase family protein n=1 Tax=Oceanibium sediminis TaxID=2026339 RepID=UPI000DD3D964|nr:amidohydrolase family protein [Oceanibium sediminis]